MKRKWLRFSVCGVPWTLYVADERSVPEFAEAGFEGLTDREKCACYVNVRLAGSRERLEETACHEIEHALATSTGASSSLYGCNDKREERAILTLNGPRYAALKSAKVLRFPKPPRLT